MAAASIRHQDHSFHPLSVQHSHEESDARFQPLGEEQQKSDKPDVNHVHPLPEGSPRGQGELRMGAYHVPKPSECLMQWDEICQVIATGDLDDLKRHPLCQSEYASWAAPIRKQFGSLESYIRSHRLGWNQEQNQSRVSYDSSHNQQEETSSTKGESSSSAQAQQTQQPLCFNPEMDHSMVKCIPNDWPYAIPGDCAHYVVWCRFPIIDSSLFSTPPEPSSTSSIPFPTGSSLSNLYECVVQDGVRGLTGQTNQISIHHHQESFQPKKVIGLATVSSLLKPSTMISIPKDAKSSSDSPNSKPLDLESDEDSETKAIEIASLAHKHAGRFINDYVLKNWNEENWQTAWFCNPPHLRTVPGLSHFHVIARRKI